jgi:hypothetical protein
MRCASYCAHRSAAVKNWDRDGQVVGVRGDDVEQFAGEDGVDRLSVAVGEAFQG